MNKIPVYFMPGLAANSTIFERIKLPEDQFEMIFLEWEIPFDKETLTEYAKRMAEKITQPNPVLIGVSFGGILVQEIAAFVPVKKLIIISSVKCNQEFPMRLKMAKTTKAYKLIPTSLLLNVENLARFSFGKTISTKIKLYEKYLSVRDIHYLDWAIEQVILWNRVAIDSNVIHIQGDADEVFPIKNIQNCITVKGGSHVMILTKYKWFNENLPNIISG